MPSRERTPPPLVARTGTVCALGTFLLLLTSAIAAAQPAVEGARSEPPALVVLIAVDQFRADYVERFGHQWTKGLRRLLSDGAVFTEALYPYARTVTCAGHATLGTGALPDTHGMIENTWFDRASGREITCTEDSEITNVGYGGATIRSGDSLHRLRVPTLVDEMRAQLPVAPRIVSMSNKARSAMALVGQRSDLTTWFEGPRGWVTTPAMNGPERVPFLASYLAAHPVEADAEKVWDRSLPGDAYLFEAVGRAGVTFPHRLAPPPVNGATDPVFYGTWQMSPFIDEYLTGMAKAAVSSYGLGTGARHDVLAISYSALDTVGHAFGPRSHEVQDMLVRLDGTLADLFDHLDAAVGAGRWVVALSSDHGVSPIPAHVQSMGLRGGVVSRDVVTAAVNDLIGADAVVKIVGNDIYLRPQAADALAALSPEARDTLLARVARIDGVARAFSAADLLAGRYNAADPLAQAVRLSTYEERSGDIITVTDPYWFPSTDLAATHGTPYRYDQHVPLIFLGAGIAPGTYDVTASPADLAPTLARLLGVTLPAPHGRALTAALAR